jgi:CubicO group peptidase (beta-lactamase class C family)
MSEYQVEKIVEILESGRAEGLITGAVFGSVNSRGEQRVIPFGTFSEDSSQLIKRNSIFDVASVTKTIPTSTLALIAIEKGLFAANTKVTSILSELSGKFSELVTVEHLLTQTLHFNIPLSSYKDLSAESLLNKIFCFDFPQKPGTTFNYCNATSIILALCVEKVFGKKLPQLANDLIFSPCKMVNSQFNPVDNLKEKIVPTEFDSWRNREIRGEIHDESAFVLNSIITPGSAGLFSTVPDILNFLQMIIGGGSFDGKNILLDKTVDSLSQNRVEYLNLFAGLGWELNQRRYTGKFASDKTIGKTGFTGSVIMADMEKKKALTLLTNFTHPKRKQDVTLINSLRKAVADVVFS